MSKRKSFSPMLATGRVLHLMNSLATKKMVLMLRDWVKKMKWQNTMPIPKPVNAIRNLATEGGDLPRRLVMPRLVKS